MSYAEFNAVIYRNIGIEFHPIVSALNLRVEPVSFSELYSQLISHEILLKSHQVIPVANLAVRPPSTSAPHTNSTGMNHTPYRGSNTRKKCQICGYNNHTADKCRRRYESWQSVSPPS